LDTIINDMTSVGQQPPRVHENAPTVNMGSHNNVDSSNEREDGVTMGKPLGHLEIPPIANRG